MTDTTIRPTAKFIKAGAVMLAAIVVGVDIAYFVWMRDTHDLGMVPLLLPVLLLWPATRWFRLRYTKAVLSGGRLRYESGFASKSTRNIQLSKVQDVRVDQSVMQRIFSVGTISIETAGETSRLVIDNVDDPQRVADVIMTAAQKGTATT